MRTKEEWKKAEPDSMFHRLIELPILQGISLNNLEEILAGVPLHFKTIPANRVFFKQDDSCNGISFVLRGKFSVTHKEVDNRYSISEEFEDDFTIEPTSMFGLKSTYFATYKAITELQLLFIDKASFLLLLSKFTIVQMNIFNMMNARTQVVQKRNWVVSPNDIGQRLVHFTLSRLERPEGPKTLLVSYRTLGRLLNSSHITVAQIAKKWEEEGLVELSNKTIHIPDMEKLRQSVMDVEEVIDDIDED
ncbi:MAG: Crp/Fnr family transcriptional regulator [Bacteroidaceae bacterium]